MYKSWIETTRLNGQPVNSLTMALEARGCSYAKARKAQGKPRCTFCPFHGFGVATEDSLSPDKLAENVRATLDAHDFTDGQIRILRIYMGGSFFAQQELRPQERAAVLRTIAGYHNIRKLFVESRPEHIRTERIREARGILNSIKLEVAMGLETSDDALRERTGKGFRLVDFERAAKVLADHDIAIAAYLLIKPVPTTDEAAMEDTLRSLRYLAELRTRLGATAEISARLEPFAIYDGMEVKPGHTPPTFEIIVQIIQAAPEGLELHLGLNESEVGSSSASPFTQQMRGLIDRFNSTGDRRVFD